MRIALGLCAAGATLALLAPELRADETGLAESHDLHKESGRLCMSEHAHSGYGEGASKSTATNAAVKSWIEFTDFEYGSSWAHYSVAAGKSSKFTKEVKGWSATVEARPCKG